MIRAFVDDVVFGRHPDWRTVAAGPYVANQASWRALPRAGFDHVTDIVHEGDTEACRLMVRRRT